MNGLKKVGLAGLVLAAAAAATGCASQHVHFTREGGNPPFETAEYTYPGDGFQDANVFRLCFDEEGSPYPDPRVLPVDEGRLGACGSRLRAYFSGSGDYDPERLAGDFARRINAFCSAPAPRTLVVLIHGINNSYPEARRTYELARMRVSERIPARRVAFLEVYWDARHGDPFAVWGFARPASKWVGLGLRRVLRHLDPEVPLRVLAHSRGASVICSALWNVPFLEDEASNELFRRRQAELPAPRHPQVRVGLLVPAMPEGDFDSYFSSGPGKANPLEGLVVGVNEDDPAVGKGPLPSDWFGSTRLGCDLEVFRSQVAPRFNRGRLVAHLVDLSASEVHDFKDYLLRKAFTETFLPLWLSAPADLPGDR